jgi:sugar/nucleoside kinase (ribokinase family)
MQKRYDVFGMCNALFDLQAEVTDSLLETLGVAKGSMTLLSEEEQRGIVPSVYTHIVNTAPGGSGANTMIGIAQLGGTAVFTSRVGPDEHGALYRESLETLGVKANLGTGEGQTGISLVMISPDAQRTMGTFLGLSRDLQLSDVVVSDIVLSQCLYVTGYLWDTDNQKEAVEFAMREAKAVGVKVALSLSDPFCVGRHKEDFTRLLKEYVDVVFANKDEAMMMVPEATDELSAARALAELTGGLAVVTRDKDGSLLVTQTEAVEIPIYPVKAIDTTGAGDMYAAGILYGLAKELPLPITGRVAAYCAAQVVAHLGPRVEQIDPDAIASILRGDNAV